MYFLASEESACLEKLREIIQYTQIWSRRRFVNDACLKRLVTEPVWFVSLSG